MSRLGSQSLLLAGLGSALLLALGAVATTAPLPIGRFSTAPVDSNGHPAAWTPVQFGDIDTRTQYKLVQRPVGTDTIGVVRAVSNGGAAGLGRSIRFSPSEYPILTWQWKVSTTLEEGDARTKDGDDYPARIYVSFDYPPEEFGFFDRMKYKALQALGYDQIPTRALNYIWANRVEPGTLLPNPFTDWVQMIAVQSGSTRTGTWMSERRNLRADYRRAFGEAPPAITGIAIMTDTDNTDAAATAFYGEIVARKDNRGRTPPPDSVDSP